MSEKSDKIALFWDFENIHASLMSIKHGASWFKYYRGKPTPEVLDVKSIVDFANAQGDLIINRAYANWQWLGKYAHSLNENAIELIQMFPRGGWSKNGADILLSIDIIEYMNMIEDIDTIILVSGDSDFIPVAKRVRRRAKKIIGIGVKETSNPFWINTCNEFKFYGNLIKKSSGDDNLETISEDVDIEEARAILIKAMKQIAKKKTIEWVEQGMIKPFMMRLDPSFDEQTYGFNSFGKFLRAQPDVLESRADKEKKSSEYRLKDKPKSTSKRTPKKESKPRSKSSNPTTDQYIAVLNKQRFRLPHPHVILMGLKAYDGFIRSNSSFKNNNDIDGQCYKAIKRDIKDISMAEIKKLRLLFSKCFIFKRDNESGMFVFHQDVTDGNELRIRLFKLMIKRIRDNINDKLDARTLSYLLSGDEELFSEEIASYIKR